MRASPSRLGNLRARTGSFLVIAAFGASSALWASDASSAEVVFSSGFIGVNILPSGVQGGASEINHVPGTGQSQALVISFGAPVFDIQATLGAFLTSEGGAGCTEVGRWTAFNENGIEIGTDTFVAGGPSPVVTSEPASYVAWSAEPYDGGCTSTSNTADSSDYTITSLSWSLSSGGAPVSLNTSNGAPLAVEDFLAYDTNEPFTDGTQLLGLDGEPLVPAFVVGEETCTGGEGTGSGDEDNGCDLAISNPLSEITVTIPAASGISGTVAVVESGLIEDGRAACGNTDPTAPDGPLTLSAYPANGGVLTIPADLCGIPNPVSGTPEIAIVDLESDLIVENSEITHEVEDPDNTDFACKEDPLLSDDRNFQPVFGWLPKSGEIPVLGADLLTPVNVLEDLTDDGCGSYRGRTGRASYLAFNLRHRADLGIADYVRIVRADLEQISNTLNLSEVCVNPGNFAAAQMDIHEILKAFDLGDRDQYARARELLVAFLDVLENETGIAGDFGSCFFDIVNGNVFNDPSPSEPLPPGVQPRNFRGDLLSQGKHALYMLDDYIGAAQAPMPPMSLKLDGLGGNPTTALLWSATLGKFKNGKIIGSFTPYSLQSCELSATKVFKVNDEGIPKFRAYDVPLTQIAELNAKVVNKQYTANTGNGNTKGRRQILSRNRGKTRGLEEDMPAALSAAYTACATESANEGWGTGAGVCLPEPGVDIIGRCDFAEFPGGDESPRQVVTVKTTYDDSGITVP